MITSRVRQWFRLPPALAVGLIAVTGCESPARRLDPTAIETIKPGVTTRQDVLREFGTPRETISADGRTVLIYQRDYAGWRDPYAPTRPASITGLSVLIDRDDRVLRTHYSSHNVEVYAGAGSLSAGSAINDQSIGKIQTGRTTRQEAIALFGEPAFESLSTSGDLVLHWIYYEANFAGGRRLRELKLMLNGDGVVRSMKSMDVP